MLRGRRCYGSRGRCLCGDCWGVVGTGDLGRCLYVVAAGVLLVLGGEMFVHSLGGMLLVLGTWREVVCELTGRMLFVLRARNQGRYLYTHQWDVVSTRDKREKFE